MESCPTSNMVVANLDQPPLLKLLEMSHLRVALATDDPGLLGVFPRAEVGRVEEQGARDRLLATAAQASFVTCAEGERTT